MNHETSVYADGELAFYHSNIGLEPESQSFEFDDNDLDSTGCRSGNQKFKETEKRVAVDLNRNQANLDLSPYKMEAEDGLTSSTLDSHVSMIDLKNDNEVKLKDFVKLVSHSSQDVESFREFPSAPCPDFPQDIESVKSSPIMPISDLPVEVDSFKNPADIYMDKSVMECEPELVVCYKESNDHVIKDICVDEGIPAKDKILLENNFNEEAAYKFSPLEDNESGKLSKDNIGIDVPFQVLVDLPALTEESDKVSTNHYKYEDLTPNDEDATGKVAKNVDKEILLPGYKLLLQDLDEEQSMPFIDEGDKTEQNYSQVSSEPELHSKPKESEDRVEEAVSTSSLALAVNESNGDILISDGMPDNGSITSQFDPLVLAASAKEESDQVGGLKCDDTRNSSEPVDVESDDQAVTSHICYTLGESSFSAVGRVSSRMSYSDPVPYSGSISLRSDSSATSTRSFAFPVLQSEWNSSPVRMAKADRRHYRKHRCWRQGLLCCRF